MVLKRRKDIRQKFGRVVERGANTGDYGPQRVPFFMVFDRTANRWWCAIN